MSPLRSNRPRNELQSSDDAVLWSALDDLCLRRAILVVVLPRTLLKRSVPGARVALLKKMLSRNVDGFGLPEEAWREAA